MTTEEMKSKAQSFGLHTGEFVALRHIYQNWKMETKVSEDYFLRKVSELLGASQNREA